MHSSSFIFSLISIATLASAQAGRFPCFNRDAVTGVITANPAACVAPTATGTSLGEPSSHYQQDGFTPVGSQCVLDPSGSGEYFCGYVGAACNPQNPLANSACDNGPCIVTNAAVPTVGTCQGYFGTVCNGLETNCLGFLYCTDQSSTPTPADTCGGIGSYCQDPFTSGLADNVQQEAVFNAACASGYCSFTVGTCAIHTTLNQDCSVDPQFSCGAGLSCTTNPATGAQTCTPTVNPSQRARARRNEIMAKRLPSSLCPLSQTACSLYDSRNGFECIDTQSNLEQCGACGMDGGIDCTSLPGVDAVGCVLGTCEIWQCAAGFAWDPLSLSCTTDQSI